MSQTPLLEARDLGRAVEGRWLWRHLALELRAGEIGVVSGPSGSGKSLLFRALCGLDLPDEGTVMVGSAPLEELDRPTLRSRVLFLSQDPVIVPGTVLENLELPFGFGVHADRDPPTREELVGHLERLGKTGDFLERSHEVLSGGESQIVALLRVLLLGGQVLLLDEPTANLDPEAAAAVEELVAEWVRSGDRAALWTSHDHDQAERVRTGPRVQVGGGS